MDHAYDPVPGEPPIAPMPDYELGAPYSWLEYETDNRLHSIMVHDQIFKKILFILKNSKILSNYNYKFIIPVNQ
jgi:hypothetical protein